MVWVGVVGVGEEYMRWIECSDDAAYIVDDRKSAVRGVRGEAVGVRTHVRLGVLRSK